mmetsp:Transcript_18023/g.36231  ORF Transcript_18023/g.36231 Transcript_18023/m.36231 type:complete len:708 (-) Transcript_18023:62-2185(-)
MCLKTMINDGGLAKVLEVADRVSSDLFALNNPHQSSSGRRSNGHSKRQRFAKVGSADVGPSSPTCTDDNASCQCGKPHHSNERKCEELEATRCQEVSAPSAAPGEEAASGSDTKAPFEKSSSGMRRKPSRTLSELNSFNSEGQLSCLPVSNESDGNEELQSRELHEDHPPNAQPQHIMTKDASSLSSSSSSSSSNPSKQVRMNLSKNTSAELKQVVTPLIESLKNLDAAALLSLNPSTRKGGAIIDKEKGLMVNPIHDFISPNYDPPTNRGDSDEKFHIVRYLHVHEVPNKYSMGIFVFPPHAEIPLHDHPNMVVLSRVLYGELKVQSYDLLPKPKPAERRSNEKRFPTKGRNCRSDTEKTMGNRDFSSSDPALDKEFMDQQAAANTMISLSKPLNLFKNFVSRAMSPYYPSNSSCEGDRQGLDKFREDNREDSTSADEESDASSSSCSSSRKSPEQDAEPRLASNTILKAKENLTPMGVVFNRKDHGVEASISAPHVTALYPYEGNCHAFVAGPHGAAVLDILLPPYDSEDNRDCTFYKASEDAEEMAHADYNNNDVFHHHHSHIHHDPREFLHSSRRSSSTPSNASALTSSHGGTSSSSFSDEASDDVSHKRPRSFNLIPMTQPENFHCLSGSYGRFGACSTYGDTNDTDFFSDFMSEDEESVDGHGDVDDGVLDFKADANRSGAAEDNENVYGRLLDVGRCSLS